MKYILSIGVAVFTLAAILEFDSEDRCLVSPTSREVVVDAGSDFFPVNFNLKCSFDTSVTAISSDCSCIAALERPIKLVAGQPVEITTTVNLKNVRLPCTKRVVFHLVPPTKEMPIATVTFVSFSEEGHE